MNRRLVLNIIFTVLLMISVQTSLNAKDNWYKIKTENFTLIGNAKEKQIKKVGIKLEQFQESIKRLVPKLAKKPPISTTVIVFKDERSFHPFKPINSKGKITDWVAGYFQAGSDINYIAMAFDNKGADAYQTIFHEYTHNLIDHNLGRKNIPTWLNEGLAEYYDQFSVKNDQVVSFGGRNDSHISLLKTNELMPLEKLFAIDYKELRVMNQNQANLFYSQTWALTHLLIHSENGRFKSRLDKFIELITNKMPIDKAFENAFKMSPDELTLKLKNHINSKSIKANKTKFEKKLTGTANYPTSTLSRAEVQANLGDMLYQGQRYDVAEKHLLKAIKSDPDSSLANSTLGLIRMKQDRYSEARKYLKKSITSEKNGFLPHYRYAYFLSREVLTFNQYISNYSDERTAEMRKSLNISIALNPTFPDAYRLLGFINLVRNERFDEGIKNLKRAIKLSPNNQTYLLDLAGLYQRKNDFDNAVIFAEMILKNPDDEQIKEKAETIVNEIKYVRQQIAEAKKNKDPIDENQDYSIVKSNQNKRRVLTEAELEQNRRQTVDEAISEVLTKPKKGEKRILGQISKVTCSSNKVIFEITTDDQRHVLQSDSFRNIKLKTFSSEMRGELFGCDTHKETIWAVMIYRPNKDSAKDVLGDLVSIEFVHKKFVLSENF